MLPGVPSIFITRSNTGNNPQASRASISVDSKSSAHTRSNDNTAPFHSLRSAPLMVVGGEEGSCVDPSPGGSGGADDDGSGGGGGSEEILLALVAFVLVAVVMVVPLAVASRSNPLESNRTILSKQRKYWRARCATASTLAPSTPVK